MQWYGISLLNFIFNILARSQKKGRHPWVNAMQLKLIQHDVDHSKLCIETKYGAQPLAQLLSAHAISAGGLGVQIPVWHSVANGSPVRRFFGAV